MTDILVHDPGIAGRTEQELPPADLDHDHRVNTNRRLPAAASRLIAAVRGIPDIGIWVGVAIVAAGFVLIAVAWGEIAAVTNVGEQMPYLVSAGFTGLGLIVCGLTVIVVTVKWRAATARTSQFADLRDTLAALRAVLEEHER